MTTLSKFSDLTYELNDQLIFNDVRTMVPHYSYDLIYIGDVPVVTWRDLVSQTLDGESLNKYGRRTLIQKYQTSNEMWAEGFCAASILRYAEPYSIPQVKVPALDDETMQQCLELKLSDQIELLEPFSGINDSFWVDGFIFDIDTQTKTPVLTLKLTEARAFELEHIFECDVDLTDGDSVIG